MAKKELFRKVLATALTVLGLGCALALCLWLLLSSDEFGSRLRWLMILCTGALAVAIVGLLVCKVQEIRALAEIVRFDSERARAAGQQGPAGEGGPAVARDVPAQAEEAAPARPAAPVMAPAAPAAAAPAALHGGEEEDELPGIAVDLPGTARTEDAEPQHHWKPIDFKAVERQARADETARSRALEQAAAQTAPPAQPAQPAPAPQPAAPAAPAAQTAAQPDTEARLRSEQLRLAQEARMGRVRADQVAAAEQARLDELARKAEAERLARRSAGISTAPAAPAPQPADAPAENGWVKSAGTAPQPAAPAAAPAAASAAPAPAPAAEQEEVHKLNVKPIQWPAPPPPSKLFVTGQIPPVTDEMIANAGKAANGAGAGQTAPSAAPAAGEDAWQKS